MEAQEANNNKWPTENEINTIFGGSLQNVVSGGVCVCVLLVFCLSYISYVYILWLPVSCLYVIPVYVNVYGSICVYVYIYVCVYVLENCMCGHEYVCVYV